MSTGPSCQDDLCRMMSAWKGGGGGGGGGRRAEDEVTHTRFSSHSSRNCWNFWDISSWALPTALRIFPRTAGEGEKKTHTGAHACVRTRRHAREMQLLTCCRILQPCCGANGRRCIRNATEKAPHPHPTSTVMSTSEGHNSLREVK